MFLHVCDLTNYKCNHFVPIRHRGATASRQRLLHQSAGLLFETKWPWLFGVHLCLCAIGRGHQRRRRREAPHLPDRRELARGARHPTQSRAMPAMTKPAKLLVIFVADPGERELVFPNPKWLRRATVALICGDGSSVSASASAVRTRFVDTSAPVRYSGPPSSVALPGRFHRRVRAGKAQLWPAARASGADLVGIGHRLSAALEIRGAVHHLGSRSSQGTAN
jgi:hypothetical protein